MHAGAQEPGSTPEPSAAAGSTEVELAVSGMHCPSCVSLIEESLGRDPAVHRITVDLDAARASVRFDGAALSVDDLCTAVAALGYRAAPLSSGATVSGC
ncbi:MAG: heavy metal-associated domain-containing protein [Acidimicrobiales bacterium]|jgi:copper chaperone CopZ